MAITKITSGGISDIAAAIEGASDSNKFTDADHTKLNAIEASATADQTKSDVEGLGIDVPAANLTGTVATARLGSGSPGTGNFLRGDGSWQAAGSTSASDLTSGTLPMARLSGTLPALNASALTNVPKDTTVGGRKNLIINGAMQVAQRGTSSTSESYQTVDRFKTYKESCEQLAVTQTQSTESPNGFSNSFELNVGTAESSIEANDLYNIVTVFEGQNMQGTAFGTSDAKAMMLSFWVRSSKTGTYAINFYNSDATRNLTNTYAISSANTWEYKTVSILPDTSSGFSNDANRSFDIQWILTAGSDFTSSNSSSAWSGVSNPRTAYGHTATWGSSTSDDFHLTGVQLEVGSVATDFEHRSYGEELALCQRYYQVQKEVFWGYCQSGTGNRVYHTFPVQMRAAPTAADTTTASGSLASGYTENTYTMGWNSYIRSTSGTTVHTRWYADITFTAEL